MVLNPDYQRALTNFLFEPTPSEQDKTSVKWYITTFQHAVIDRQVFAAEQLLGRLLSQNQKVALRVARIFDRDSEHFVGTANEFPATLHFDKKREFLAMFDFTPTEISQ